MGEQCKDRDNWLPVDEIDQSKLRCYRQQDNYHPIRPLRTRLVVIKMDNFHQFKSIIFNIYTGICAKCSKSVVFVLSRMLPF